MIPGAILFAETMLFLAYFILTFKKKKRRKYIFGVDWGTEETCVSICYKMDESGIMFEGIYFIETN